MVITRIIQTFLSTKSTTALRSASTSATSVTSSLDPHEAAKFSALSKHWWDPMGPFAPLHRLNPARCRFIRDAMCSSHGIDHNTPEPLSGLSVLDVGCGGGILAESMARMGAQVCKGTLLRETLLLE